MSIRKLLNIPIGNEKNIINDDKELILQKCNVIAKMEYNELQESKEHHDGQCPHCKNKDKTKIINKIRNIQGKSKFNSEFRFGFGDINTFVIIESSEINHCNVCGNEWHKFKTKYVSATDILKVTLNYLAQIIRNPEEKNKSWKFEAIQVFNDTHAEAIFSLLKENNNKIHRETTKTLTLHKLRKYFSSIYGNNDELNKL